LFRRAGAEETFAAADETILQACAIVAKRRSVTPLTMK
jgi:hypothetical protein